MTAAAPTQTDPAAPRRKYEYEHIPSLKELLPSTAGRPGVEYAQISTINARKAQDEGWSPLTGGVAFYTIKGPKGSVDCMLLGKGFPIRGQAPFGGSRTCFVDGAIYEGTGHPDTSLEGVPVVDEQAETAVPSTPTAHTKVPAPSSKVKV